MNALQALEELGFSVRLEEPDRIRLSYGGPGEPDPARVKPLIEAIRAHKPEALAFLRAERPPATLAEALGNVESVFPDSRIVKDILPPAGWRRAFLYCPAGRDRDRLQALFMTGQIAAEQRDGTLFLIVTTPEGAVVTIRAGDSPATLAVMAAFEEETRHPPLFVDETGQEWRYSPALNVAFCRKTGEQKHPDELPGAAFWNPQSKGILQ